MARPTLSRHRKFLRLAREVGGRLLARGALELIWDSAYESGDPYLGQSDDVEALAEWQGERGALTRALVNAGGDGNRGFIEEVEGRPGHCQVHDLLDHAPDYVRRRMEREIQRRERGATLAEIRAEAGRRGGSVRKTDTANGKQAEANDRRLLATDEQTVASDAPPAPAPAQELPPARRTPRRGGKRETWLTPVADAHEAVYGAGSFDVLAGRFAKGWRRLVEAHGGERCARVWAWSQRDESRRQFNTPEFVAAHFGAFDPDAPAFPDDGVAA